MVDEGRRFHFLQDGIQYLGVQSLNYAERRQAGQLKRSAFTQLIVGAWRVNRCLAQGVGILVGLSGYPLGGEGEALHLEAQAE